MYDYLRLELTGYVPPPPASVAAYAGNNCNLVCWPVTPGATSYNILRSTTSGSGYVSITNGVTGPVCGSGANNATYLDTTAVNGTTYYYVVQSVNPAGNSTNSPQSSGATPSARFGHQRARYARRPYRNQRRPPKRDAELERVVRREFLLCLAFHAGE